MEAPVVTYTDLVDKNHQMEAPVVTYTDLVEQEPPDGSPSNDCKEHVGKRPC